MPHPTACDPDGDNWITPLSLQDARRGARQAQMFAARLHPLIERGLLGFELSDPDDHLTDGWPRRMRPIFEYAHFRAYLLSLDLPTAILPSGDGFKLYWPEAIARLDREDMHDYLSERSLDCRPCLDDAGGAGASDVEAAHA